MPTVTGTASSMSFGVSLCLIALLAGCEYRPRAQEQYTISLPAHEKQTFLQELRSGLEASGFSELEPVPMSDNPEAQSLAFEKPPVRVDLFTDDGGTIWMFSCSEAREEFSASGEAQCLAVEEFLGELPGQKARVNVDG